MSRAGCFFNDPTQGEDSVRIGDLDDEAEANINASNHGDPSAAYRPQPKSLLKKQVSAAL
jgi:hypothetical protein